MTTKEEKKGLLEGFKEWFRVALLGLVSYLLTDGIVEGLVEWFTGAKLEPSMKLAVVGLITSFLKGVDKWLYKTDRTIIPLEGSTGLTGV